MEKSFSIKTHSFINAQRQNRRRRYSISSPNLFESRAGAVVQQYDNIINRVSHINFSKTHSISSNSNLVFSSTNYDLEKYDVLSKLNIGAYVATY
ncbi:unnamed protein product, partial [Rotaria sp. Silwood1]